MSGDHPGPADTVRAATAAIREEPRIGDDADGLHIEFDGSALTIEGVVQDVAAKKLALERAAAIPGVVGIVDRLRTRPAREMDDPSIRALVVDAFLQEPAFADLGLRERIDRRLERVREPDGVHGSIEVEVSGGVVRLDGSVPGLEHKRLAGVLAWWVPGTRDVVNGMAVDPDEEDEPGAVADAVRTALEKDPFVNAAQIRVEVAGWDVTLHGYVRTPEEREMAEFDAWCVFAVDRVVNRIEVATA